MSTLSLPLISARTVDTLPFTSRLRDPATHQPGPYVVGAVPGVSITHQRQDRGAVHHLTLRVTNTSQSPLLVDLAAFVLTGLATAKATVYLPHVGGKVLPVVGANYESHVFGQLAAGWMIVQIGDEGLVLSQEKRTEDEARYRTGILVHGTGLPEGALGRRESGVVGSMLISEHEQATQTDRGGVACFTENLHLSPGDSLELGPYLIAAYSGPWTAGAAKLREIRRERPMRTWPAWMRSVRSVSEINTMSMSHFDEMPAMARTLAEWGAPVYHQFMWQDRKEEREQPQDVEVLPGTHRWEMGVNPHWAYAFDQPRAQPERGGDEALQRNIRRLREAGSRILLYNTPWTLAIDSEVGRRAHALNLHIREPDGNEFLEARSLRLCPAHAPARAYIIDACLRTLHRYDADGLFIDQTAAVGNSVCVHPEHRHENPYTWTHGMWLLFKELRQRLDRERPGTLLLLEGGSELLREFADGYLAHSHSWTLMQHDAPVSRAVMPRIGIFDSFNGYTHDAPDQVHEHCRKLGMFPRSIHYMANVQFAGGIHYYADQADTGRMRPMYEKHQPLRLAYPEMIDGQIAAELPQFDTPGITGYLFEHGGKRVLTIADLAGGGFHASRRVGVRVSGAAGLYDRIRASLLPAHEGVVRVPLAGWDVGAYEVIERDA